MGCCAGTGFSYVQLVVDNIRAFVMPQMCVRLPLFLMIAQRMKRWLLGLFLCPLVVEAGGFQLNTLNQKAAGMGGSVTGLALDAGAAFYNPAAMSMLDSSAFNAGCTALFSRTAFLGTSGGQENQRMRVCLPSHVYGAWKVKQKVAVGLSINSPFGYRTEWAENWSGRYIRQSERLSTYFVQPAISYRISDRLSLGAGPVIALGAVESIQALPVTRQQVNDGRLTLSGNGEGLGVNAGLFFQAGRTSAGISYRSAIQLDISEGTAAFENIPAIFLSNGTFPASDVFRSRLNLPSVISAGWGQKIGDRMRLSLDVNFTGWSVYDSLVVEFKDRPDLAIRSPRKFKNTMAVRVGGQYHYAPRLQLRAGLAFDPSPVQDGYIHPGLPDADRVVISGGFTWLLKKGWSIEGAVQFQEMKERREENNVENNFNGTYKSVVYAAGIGLQYMF